MATKKRPVTKSGRPRKRKGVKLEPTGLGPRELRLTDPTAEVAELSRQVEEDGGEVLAAYREPLGGHALRTYPLSPTGGEGQGEGAEFSGASP